jgi:molybdopterin-binding protein
MALLLRVVDRVLSLTSDSFGLSSQPMEESIRNQLPGTVKSIMSDKVLSEVIVETSIGDIASIITTRSVEEMKIMPGDKVFALVKATNVSLRRA